jgi:hypothetical protein
MGFNPRVRIAPGGDSTDHFEAIKLPISAESPAPVKAMLAMIAYHRNITFITHTQGRFIQTQSQGLGCHA